MNKALTPKPQRDIELWANFITRILGTQEWVIAPRLTASMQRRGYEIAISRAYYEELKTIYENIYGVEFCAMLADIHPVLYEWGIRRLEEGADVKQCKLELAGFVIKAEEANDAG